MLLRNDFSQFTHFFWDLDGTLTRSAEGIVNSVRYALESFGIKEADDEKIRRFIGPPLAESFNVFYGLNEEQCNKAIEKYREFYTEKGIFQNAVYEGIPETLQKLKESGKKLYVATSKPEVFMFRILEHFNLAQQNIANKVDVLIDGPYIDSLRDITLDLRGSSNQTISYMRKGEKHE